mgnify:CR=1 FL=1
MRKEEGSLSELRPPSEPFSVELPKFQNLSSTSGLVANASNSQGLGLRDGTERLRHRRTDSHRSDVSSVERSSMGSVSSTSMSSMGKLWRQSTLGRRSMPKPDYRFVSINEPDHPNVGFCSNRIKTCARPMRGRVAHP